MIGLDGFLFFHGFCLRSSEYTAKQLSTSEIIYKTSVKFLNNSNRRASELTISGYKRQQKKRTHTQPDTNEWERKLSIDKYTETLSQS